MNDPSPNLEPLTTPPLALIAESPHSSDSPSSHSSETPLSHSPETPLSHVSVDEGAIQPVHPQLETLKAFIELVSGGMGIKPAAAQIGIHWMQLYALRRREPWFAEWWTDAMEAGRLGVVDDVLLQVVKEAPMDSMSKVRAAEVLIKRYDRTYGQNPNPPNMPARLEMQAPGGGRISVSVGTHIPD